MKKHVADLPLEVNLHAAKSATQRAAGDAVKAGCVVTGWEGWEACRIRARCVSSRANKS